MKTYCRNAPMHGRIGSNLEKKTETKYRNKEREVSPAAKQENEPAMKSPFIPPNTVNSLLDKACFVVEPLENAIGTLIITKL